MKKFNFKKLIAFALSLVLTAIIILPRTTLEAKAEPISFPAPIMTDSPELLKEFAKPSVYIPTSFSDLYLFTAKVKGEAEEGAPQIATITEQAGPNDSISIYGTNLEGASIYAYGLENGKGVIKIYKRRFINYENTFNL